MSNVEFINEDGSISNIDVGKKDKADERYAISQPMRIKRFDVPDVDISKSKMIKNTCSKCHKSLDECVCKSESIRKTKVWENKPLSEIRDADGTTYFRPRPESDFKTEKKKLKKSVDSLIEIIEKSSKESKSILGGVSGMDPSTAMEQGDKQNKRLMEAAFPGTRKMKKGVPGAGAGGAVGAGIGALAGGLPGALAGGAIGAGGGHFVEEGIASKKKMKKSLPELKKALESVNKAISDIEEIQKSEKIEKIAPWIVPAALGAGAGFLGSKLLDKNKKCQKSYSEDEVIKSVNIIEDIINSGDDDDIKKGWQALLAQGGKLKTGGRKSDFELELGGKSPIPETKKEPEKSDTLKQPENKEIQKAVAEPADSIKLRKGDGQTGINNPTTSNPTDLEPSQNTIGK